MWGCIMPSMACLAGQPRLDRLNIEDKGEYSLIPRERWCYSPLAIIPCTVPGLQAPCIMRVTVEAVRVLDSHSACLTPQGPKRTSRTAHAITLISLLNFGSANIVLTSGKPLPSFLHVGAAAGRDWFCRSLSSDQTSTASSGCDD